MYNTAYFSRIPSTDLPGTRSKKPQIVGGTSLHGDIVPLFCNLVMPGTIDSCIMNGQIWMSSPIAPIMSQIKGAVNTFFVPLRLVWKHTKEFFGENKTTSGPQETIYTIPRTTLNNISDNATKVKVGSVSHYLGKPLFKGSSIDSSNKLLVSVLKERAYWLVVSEYYRHQQVQEPFIMNDDDVNGHSLNPIGSVGSDTKNFESMPAKCLKDFDYFTTATTEPNYGGEVLLPLGSLAPVITGPMNTDIVEQITSEAENSTGLYQKLKSGITGIMFAQSKGVPYTDGGAAVDLRTYQGGSSQGALAGKGTMRGSDDIPIVDGSEVFYAPSNLYADLSKATAAKIDDLYTAMAAQAWYHNANYGSRYFEMLEIHYGVSNPDLVLDRPEHVSEFTFDIIVQDVISMAGAAADSSTKLGQPGAYSKTYLRKRLYNHSFGEWGFVICLMNTYHQRYYSAGVEREDLYSELFDFYFPEFANRGDDYIFRAENYASSGALDNLEAWAYQEAYADRRYYKARATGQLDAYCSASVNGKNPIGRWILNEKWDSRPSFGEEFLTEDRAALADALVSGQDGPDFVWNFNFEHTEILPMPAHSKPGVPSFGRGLV